MNNSKRWAVLKQAANGFATVSRSAQQQNIIIGPNKLAIDETKLLFLSSPYCMYYAIVLWF